MENEKIIKFNIGGIEREIFGAVFDGQIGMQVFGVTSNNFGYPFVKLFYEEFGRRVEIFCGNFVTEVGEIGVVLRNGRYFMNKLSLDVRGKYDILP